MAFWKSAAAVWHTSSSPRYLRGSKLPSPWLTATSTPNRLASRAGFGVEARHEKIFVGLIIQRQDCVVFLVSAYDVSAIIARMKSSYRGFSILLAMSLASVACIGQAAATPAAASDDVQVLVKQGQKLNSEGKQDQALRVYKLALEKS